MRSALLLLALGVFPLLAQVKLPPFTRQVLDNGVVLLLSPRKDVPLVTVQATVRGGLEAEPAGLAGLATATAQLLRKGTATRTAEQFSRELDSMGADFSAGSDPQSIQATIEFLSKDADRALALYADALLRPSFPVEEVKKLVAQSIDANRAVKDSPQQSISRYFQSAYYGASHPYGRPADEVSLGHITREAVTQLHQRLFAGRNTIVTAVGDFDPQELGPKLAKAFSAAPAGQAYAWVADPAARSLSSSRLILVDKPDATQTYFYIGQPGTRRTDPDRVPLLLVNTLFGGRFTSMLNDELRVNSGLTYGASSGLPQNRLAGYQAIQTYTQTGTTAKAIDLALDVRQRLLTQGITAEQLASAKAYLKGNYPSERLETHGQIAALLTELELYGLNKGEVDDFFSRIDAVTVEQANEVARRHYGSKGLLFVLVGNAAKIRNDLKRYAPEVSEVPIARPGFSIQ